MFKSNDNDKHSANTCLPLPPEPDVNSHGGHHIEMEIYARFMRHLRMVPSEEMDIKVLSAIQFTADILDLGDALVTKTLVDQGLRAPRRAFPTGYLDFVDRSFLRSGWAIGGPTESAAALKQHWDKIGEDQFAAVRHQDVVVPFAEKEEETAYLEN